MILAASDRELLNGIMAMIRDEQQGSTGRTATAEGGTELWDELDAMAARGDERAARLMRTLGTKGGEDVFRKFLKQDQMTVRVYRDGTVEERSIPSRMGVRTDEGYQMWLWVDLSWEQFGRMCADYFRQAEVMNERGATLRLILSFKDKHPETRTPGEALALEGIDPGSLDVAL